MTDTEVVRVGGADLSPTDLYVALSLRAAVFVVEQECPYLDPDGRDLEPTTEHLWLRASDGTMTSYLRVLREADGTTRIGRVVTHPAHRGRHLADRLLDAALARARGPVVLSAQSHLAHVYARHGFERDGDDFLDDGIPHTPMRRGGDRPVPP